ncbi:MAG: deoxyribose-phosphate aldolase [Sphaerochaetaceae bacterium]|nr:deoxyribose-phosphate aldolase [Sphaerochaetaceae bacterium]
MDKIEKNAMLEPKDLAKYIDHTMLKADAVKVAFDKLCDEAIEYSFKSVCVNSSWVAYVANRLQGTKVQVCSVVGFPLGAMSSKSKAFEAEDAIAQGAREIDMVLAVGRLKMGDVQYVEDDIKAVRQAAKKGVILKVIIETAMLTKEEKITACRLAKAAGADFVKTCTGFGGGAATAEDIALMQEIVGPAMGVKASGGVRNYDKAIELIGAGATRLGAQSSIAIVTGK